jgi:D-alanyl-lipoteichoic acid acyltransferase DltB (MBOAT superfamily)
MIWAATLGFTVQILADFSGYTDIARGVARMLGWELMENFRNPYIATNPGDFWRRWHISFSSWIRDYLYISFGGSRGTKLRTDMAIMASMLISGLWHGASWNFVVWGAYHGVLQIAYRRITPLIPETTRNSTAGHISAVALMFSFTVFGWLLFRETDMGRILYYLTLNPFTETPEQRVATAVMLAVTAFTAAPLVLGLVFQKLIQPKIQESEWYLPLQTTAWAAFAVGIFLFVRVGASDFIYFQF